MVNMRKKRCTNPACRKSFSYVPGGVIHCPWCEEGTQRDWTTFRFGVDALPKLQKGYFTVQLDRPAAMNKKLAAVFTDSGIMRFTVIRRLTVLNIRITLPCLWRIPCWIWKKNLNKRRRKTCFD